MADLSPTGLCVWLRKCEADYRRSVKSRRESAEMWSTMTDADQREAVNLAGRIMGSRTPLPFLSAAERHQNAIRDTSIANKLEADADRAKAAADLLESQVAELAAVVAALPALLDDEAKTLPRRVADEMADFQMVLDHASRVFCHVTNGAISKPNTDPAVVCAVADDCVTDLVHEALAEDRADSARFDFAGWLAAKNAWSLETFGPGARTEGVLAHLRKELDEVAADPADLAEWVDLVFLATDGAFRVGHSPEALIAGLVAKLATNKARLWPDWRTATSSQPIEHLREVS